MRPCVLLDKSVPSIIDKSAQNVILRTGIILCYLTHLAQAVDITKMMCIVQVVRLKYKLH